MLKLSSGLDIKKVQGGKVKVQDIISFHLVPEFPSGLM
jgi:hypothetical protein